MIKSFLLFFFVSMSPAYASIILMDYTLTVASKLEHRSTSTLDRNHSVMAFLDDVLGEEFNFIKE